MNDKKIPMEFIRTLWNLTDEIEKSGEQKDWAPLIERKVKFADACPAGFRVGFAVMYLMNSVITLKQRATLKTVVEILELLGWEVLPDE